MKKNNKKLAVSPKNVFIDLARTQVYCSS